jgi:hypothetical protein
MMMPEKRLFVVKYPPDYDGELHVETTVTEGAVKRMEVRFTISLKPGESSKEALVRAAKDITRVR